MEQAKIPEYLGKCEILHIHDDGDLTIECGNKKYVVTTEGEVFKEIKRESICDLITGRLIRELVNAIGMADGNGKYTKDEARKITGQLQKIVDKCHINLRE